MAAVYHARDLKHHHLVALKVLDQRQEAAGYARLQLARVYALAGRRNDAIETLAELLKTHLYITPGWLRIDPTFTSLKSDPRFQRLAADSTRQ